MKNTFRRRRRYIGTGLTSQSLAEVLPRVLRNIGEVYKERGDLILAAWPEIIGSRLEGMTQALSFESGVLYVRVGNSTLYSLLRTRDKPALLKSLRAKFPNTIIKTIVFRMG